MNDGDGSTAREEIATRAGKVWLDAANGVVRFQAAPDVQQTLSDAKANIEATIKLSKGKTYPFLCDLTKMKALTTEARAYYGSDEARASFRALALLGTSHTSKMLGNIFLAIYGRKDKPTRLFTSEADAIAWLQGFAE